MVAAGTAPDIAYIPDAMISKWASAGWLMDLSDHFHNDPEASNRMRQSYYKVQDKIVGANCGIAIEQMIEIIAAMRVATDRPILTHINAGIPKLVDGTKVLYPDTPEHMATLMSKVVEAGANIVGGCCGTNPDHVRAFVQALRG